MRALRFERFGPPDVLTLRSVPDPVARPGESAVVAVKATSINPSDVKNVAGAMHGTLLPRTPGRDFSGVVIDGPEAWRGVPVWGTGGEIGFTVDGAHAERLLVPLAALVRKPARLSHDDAACVGVNFVTAWLGMVEYGAVQPGEWVAVIGVAGGVGGAAAQIAHAAGARVIGVARTPVPDDAPAAGCLDAFVAAHGAADGPPDGPDIAAEIRAHTGGEGAALVYDTVGGTTMTPVALAAAARRGRVIAVSATTGRTVPIDLIDLYRNETRLIGADSRKLGMTESARILAALTPYFDTGAYRPLPIAQRYALADGAAAYRAVAAGVRGRVVLWP